MNTKKIFLALAFVATFLFVSCSPNSDLDEQLYGGDPQGVTAKQIKDAQKRLAKKGERITD